ncbi:putative ribonuclease H-like domain-containing protein [Tanacetum coccineum]
MSFYKSTTLNTWISNEKVNTVRVNGVNTVRQTSVSTVKGTGITAVKASAGCVWRPKMTDLNNVSKDNSGSWVSKRGNPQQALKNKGIFNSGCSRHMTGNKDFLIDYQDIDGGFVAFGGSARGGKITGKIRTDKLDFEDVFFVKELKTVVPSGDLTCLFAKATIDESKLWHRRLGHVNFKIMNKLVKENLVRGLPLKIFDNDHTCVACQKGKQHKASCKAKLMSFISQPLQMLQMDLFGLTFVRSINHKTYCLEVTDDFSRYKSSDETYKNDTADDAVGEATRASSNNSFNTVSTPVNTASTPRTSNDAGPSFVPLGGSFPLNVNDLPDVPFMPNLEDTAEVHNIGIFGSAFDDEDLDTYNSPFADQVMGAEADFNNMEPSTVISPIPTTKVHSIHLKNQIVRDLRIEAIRLFLAYASFMNFVVYQMDVKSAFLYGTIEDEVYVSQHPGFMDPEFLEKVYKVEKALYGLHQAPRALYETLSTYLLDNGFYRGQIDKTLFIKRVKGDILLVQVYVDDIIFGSTKKSLCTDFEQIIHKMFQMSLMGELTFFLGLQVKQKEDGIFISQDKYVGEILNKFGFSSVGTANTPMETNKALTKDEDGEDVDIHLYRLMIGSLMYLTSSRPDIIDYAGASLDRKSTIGGCQFFGSRLISLQCKKQIVMANSTTKAEYIVASHCCGQVLWIQNQMFDYGYNFMQTKIHVYNKSAICVVKNPVYHSKTKHIEIRHHFIRDSYEKRLIEMVKIHTDNNVADLLNKAFDRRLMMYKYSGLYTSWIEVGSVERAITTASSLDAAQDSDNIIRTQTTTMPNVDIPQGMDTGGSPKLQDTIGGALAQTKSKRMLENPNEPPLSEGHTSGSGEGRMENQFELTANVPITSHDSSLLGGFTPGSDEAVEILRLKKRVKRLERKRKSRTSQPRRRKYRQVASLDDDLKWMHPNRGGAVTRQIHTLFMDGTPMEINMLVEKKYPLIKELLEKMLNLQLEAEEESTMTFELIKFIKSMLEE